MTQTLDATSSAGRSDPHRVPVIVGVGEVNDRPVSPDAARDSFRLMYDALIAASADGGGGWLERCRRIFVVPQLSFGDLNIPAAFAEATGLSASAIVQAPLASGDTPIHLLNDAANAIGAGEVDVCAIVGAEAMRTALAAGRPLFPGAGKTASALRKRYGLLQPGEIYALYENAFRAQQKQSLAQGQAETGRIWSLMSQAASTSEGAWLKSAKTPEEIVQPTADNRPIVFPFTKFMVANASVNQGAGFFVTSLAVARAAGIPESKLVYVGLGAAPHESEEPIERADWTTPVAMRVSLEEVLARNGLSGKGVDLVELYSCFPCVPKMARRVLGINADEPLSVHGGLTFGGGPVANYMSHAVAAMVRRLRSGGRVGLLFGNGGHCSHNHCIILTKDQPSVAFPQDYDVQAWADAQRGPIPPLTDALEGDFPVETYTVIYGRNGGAERGIVLSRAPSGERVIAKIDILDKASLQFLTDGVAEPVGAIGRNRRQGEFLVWSLV